MIKEFESYGFCIDGYSTIEEGREAIKSRLISDNVILISSGSLTKPENPGGSIIKIYSEDEDVSEKIVDHIIFTTKKKAYILI